MNIPFEWEKALAFDREHIWHPYTSMSEPLTTYPVESAQGVYLNLASGEQLIDGMSSWWSTIHGYNHPKLNEALHQQLEKMSHVMFGGLSHQAAIELAEKLLAMAPATMSKIFFSDSGSVSVEVALKMAQQYWFAKAKPNKKHFLSIKGGYHGDTSGCMSVSDPDTGMHSMFSGILVQHFFAPRPKSTFGEGLLENDIEAFESLMKQHQESLAAVILEPIVQGAGGMYFYSAEYLSAVRALCDEYEILLIVDEIATGFGRTGKLFGMEHAHIQPDIMCLGKALTGGYMSLAATLTHDEIAETISSCGSGAFMHGPTFMANPLACSCALSSLELLMQNDWQRQVKGIELILKQELAKCRQLDHVHEVRVLGAIGVVELNQNVNMERIQAAFVSQGVWIRPFGKLVYLMPPYVISSSQLTQLCQAIVSVLSDRSKVF